MDEAQVHYQMCIHWDPDYAEANNNLGRQCYLDILHLKKNEKKSKRATEDSYTSRRSFQGPWEHRPGHLALQGGCSCKTSFRSCLQ